MGRERGTPSPRDARKSRHLRRFLLPAALAASLLGGSAGIPYGRVPTPALDVWTLDSLSRAERDVAQRGGNRTGRLKAARNEYEAVQIVLRAGEPLRRVSASVTALVGPGGARIGPEHIELFREHYVHVTRPSPKSPFPPAWWPDALIPFRDPETGGPLPGQRFATVPFDLNAGENQPIWLDVYVPPEATPGEYTGAVQVTVDGRSVASVPLFLTVWDFVLPRIPSTRSHFGSSRRAAEYHHVTPGTPEHSRVVERYERALMQHRLTPSRPAALQPVFAPDGGVDLARMHPALAHYMDEVGLNAWQVPLEPSQPFPEPLGRDRERTKRYLRELFTHLQAYGWARRAYVYPVDEPSTPGDYQQVGAYATLLREAHPAIRLLLTAGPVPEAPGVKPLWGAVSIWVVPFSRVDEAQVLARLAAGDELWSYTALTEGDRRLPHWQIDFPLVNYRIPLWLNWRFGLTGLLYWTTLYWQEAGDSWLNPLSIYDRFNGEGVLFYPGTPVGYEGPVPSIRVKALRDGMEDYEYLKLVADLGDRAFANTVARRMARSWSDWERDPRQLLRAREDLAARILQLQSMVPPPASLPVPRP